MKVIKLSGVESLYKNRTCFVRKKDKKLLLSNYGEIGKKVISLMDDRRDVTWIGFKYDGENLKTWNHDKKK